MRSRIVDLTSVALLGIAIGAIHLFGEENYVVQTIASKMGIQTDRRPADGALHDTVVGKTFLTFMGEDSHPYVVVYDPSDRTFSPPIKIADAPFENRHNNPFIVQDRLGHLVMVYATHETPMLVARSPQPHSADGTWWTSGPIPSTSVASYPMPAVTTGGDIYIFHRINADPAPNGVLVTSNLNDHRPQAYVVSEDNGLTWSETRTIIDVYPRDDNLTEIYMGQVEHQPAHDGEPERIHMAWTISGGGPEGHRHARYHLNLYYGYLRPDTGHMYNVEGVDLGPTIDDGENEQYCKVFDNAPARGRENMSTSCGAHWRDNGYPIIGYIEFYRFRISFWNGSAWEKREPVSGISDHRHRPVDMEKFGTDSFRFYTGSIENGMEVFTTLDGGSTWERTGVITTPNEVETSVVVKNAPDSARILMTEDTGNRDLIPDRDIWIAGIDPDAPKGITAWISNQGMVVLGWMNQTTEGATIEVDRRSVGTGSDWDLVATLSGTAESYVDSDFPPASTLEYRLRVLFGDDRVSISSVIRVVSPAIGADLYLEESGLCIFEAEDFAATVRGLDTTQWQIGMDITASEASFMTTGRASVAESWAQAAEISYAIAIQNPGTYSLAVRRRAADGENSASWGIDGQPVVERDLEGNAGTWQWTRSTQTVDLDIGLHHLHLRRRENRWAIDRIMMANDPGLLPTGSDVGPASSPRVPVGFRLAVPGDLFRDGDRVVSAWFGRLNPTHWPWILHDEHGWLLVLPGPIEGAFWAYDPQLGWIWVSVTAVPLDIPA